ncbi:MAG TPA: hypothetical protein PK082_11230, partial [Phycisphaerae bacterium]|nr:hypothetical protein [Phycisphaerae bacterium]
MPVETFHSLIARNKRNSAILIAAFLLFFVGMGLLIGYVLAGFWGVDRPRNTLRWTIDDQEAYEVRRAEQVERARWTWGISVAAGAAGVAFLLTLGSYYGGQSVLLGMSRAKQITKADDPQLFNVVEEMCLAGGAAPAENLP